MRRALVSVIGGGIGGLSASIALRNAGIETQIFERSPSFTETGVAVGITPNGMKALDALGHGIGAAVRHRGRPLAPDTVFPIRTANGHTIGSIGYGRLQLRHGAPFVMIRRVDLHAILLEAHGERGLHPGAELIEFQNTSTGVTAHFANGHQTSAEMLIGADGLRSIVRAQLFGLETPRYVATTLRGVGRVALPHELAEGSLTVGDSVTLFSMPLPGVDEHHWSAVIKTPAGTWPRDAGESRTALLDRMKDWAFPCTDLLTTAEEGPLVARTMYDRPPLTTWSRDRVTLLGDAAHPMNNSLGQGANTALEDSIVLAECLAAARSAAEALSAYEHRRIPRTTKIVLRSARTSEGGRARVEGRQEDDLDDFSDWLYSSPI